MNVKKFIPCIYLYRTHAVMGLEDLTIVETDPVRLARSYSENNADALIVFDMSVGDDEHAKALDILQEICGGIEKDVYGAGNIERMEDVKKILYAGCKKVILNYGKQSNIELTQEVSLKFGKEKILASYSSYEVVNTHKELLETYVSGLVSMNVHNIRETAAITQLPVIVQIRQLALNKLLEVLALDYVCGITGNTINQNIKDILTIKDLCRENHIPVEMLEPACQWSDFTLNSDGLIPVVTQDCKTGEVLMVAYMNEDAYKNTIRTGKMTYFSRSRGQLWLKGETSGHFQYVRSLRADCDMDTLLAQVFQVGAACHTGAHSCFFNEVLSAETDDGKNPLNVFENVYDVIKDRKLHPKEGSYTNYLFEKGIDKILKKLGEEATEIVIAAKNPNPNEIKYEISDFLYHMMVLMAEKDIGWEEITKELARR